MAKRACARCGQIVKGRCATCYPAKDQRRGKTAERGYDHRWKALSAKKRKLDPLCEECLKHEVVRPAEHVHHIKPISTHPDLRLDWNNLISVCVACHEKLEGQ